MAAPPAAQGAGAPADERALKHHYFFQKLYASSPAEGEDDICFGTGYRTPKVPIVLQTIPEGRDSKQYTCRIEGSQFVTQAAAVGHMHDAHKIRIEHLLFDLLQDMEQNHMGYFFSKLLYSDFIYPSPIFNSKELSSEFPSVLAPDLERPDSGKGKTPTANGKAAGAESKKKQAQANKGANGVAAVPGSTFGFTEEELQQMERRLFSGRFLVDASTEAKLSAKTPAAVVPQSGSPAPTPAPAATATSTAAAVAAATASAAPKGKAEAANTAAEKAAKKKEAKEAAAREAALKEQAAREAAKERQAAAEKAAKEKAEKEKAEKEKERQRREAERKQAEKERQEKEKAAKAAAEAAERERIRLESTAEFKKVKKQIEDELMTDLFEEVISDFMNKLAARTLQEQRREEEKAKQEAAERAAAEAEAQQEQEVSAKEKRQSEKKILRDLKKLEGDRMIDDVIDEVVFEESLALAPELLQEMRREAQVAAAQAAAAAQPAGGARRASATAVPLNAAAIPQGGAMAMPQGVPPGTSWSAPVSVSAVPRLATAPSTTRAVPPATVAMAAAPVAARATAAPPAVLRAGAKGAASKGATVAVPAYQPFPLASSHSHSGSSLSVSAESGEGADEFDEYLAHERLKLNLEVDEHLDGDDEHHQSPATAAGSTNIFGLFSSKLTEPVANPTPASPAAFAPSPRRLGGAKPSAPAAEPMPSVPQTIEPPPRQGGMSPPPPPLRSVPEDFGFDPQLSVTCYNLPSIVPVNRGEILGFFRDCTIAVAPPDFAPKVTILRGAESGACYVQFENPAAVQKALTRDRHMLRDRAIRVVPAQGLRTSNSGQRFALNVQTRNAQGQGPLGSAEPAPALFRAPSLTSLKAPEPPVAVAVTAPPVAVETVKPLAAMAAAALEQPAKGASSAPEEPAAASFTGFGLPLISDFRPTAAPATSQHSLSSLLNTEQDTIVTPFDRKAKSGAAIGSAVGAPGKAPGPPAPAKALGPVSNASIGGGIAPPPSSLASEEDDLNNDETFASSFGGEGSFDASGQFVSSAGGGAREPAVSSGHMPPSHAMPQSVATPVFAPLSQLPLPTPVNPAYMRAASPPAPQYRAVGPPPVAHARVVTPPPPGFHVPLSLPLQVPPGFVTAKGMPYGTPLGAPQPPDVRQPTVAPASSAEAAFMDRFL